MSATSRDMHPHRYAFCGARALPDLYAGFCMNRGRGAARGDVACRRVMPTKTAGDAILRASLVATSRPGAGWRASHGTGPGSPRRIDDPARDFTRTDWSRCRLVTYTLGGGPSVAHDLGADHIRRLGWLQRTGCT